MKKLSIVAIILLLTTVLTACVENEGCYECRFNNDGENAEWGNDNDRYDRDRYYRDDDNNDDEYFND